MQLRPMADLARALQACSAEWLEILREDLQEQDAPQVRRSTESLAKALGVRESALAPFLRWADGEVELRHICNRRFEGWINDHASPMKLLVVRPGPMSMYRGFAVVDADLEWPASRGEAIEVASGAEYRYNTADEWTSVFECREACSTRPRLDRENTWAGLVRDIVATDCWPDIERLLRAPVRLAGHLAPVQGPQPLLSALAKRFADEESFAARLPEARKDEGRVSWLANRLGIAPYLALEEMRRLETAHARLGPVTLARLDEIVKMLPDYEAACLQTSDPEFALESIENIVRELRWQGLSCDQTLPGRAAAMLERLQRREQFEQESGY